MSPCPICGETAATTTTFTVCAPCCSDLEFLRCAEMPKPDMTRAELEAWAKRNKIMWSRCNFPPEV